LRSDWLKVFIYERVAERDREEIRQIQPRFQAAFETFREAGRKASPTGRPYVEFWMRRTQFAVEWLDLLVACADLGNILGNPLAPEHRACALVAVEGLLARSKALIELIIGDAKHMGDLGQIANLNQHIHRYLKGLRTDIIGIGCKTPDSQVC
jgi:hypothetical protein